MNSCWLTLVYTLACIVAYRNLYTIMYMAYILKQSTHIMYRTRATPVMHVANNKRVSVMLVQTLTLTNIVTYKMHCIQFKCTCACLYRPLILCTKHSVLCVFPLYCCACIHFFDSYNFCMLSSLLTCHRALT